MLSFSDFLCDGHVFLLKLVEMFSGNTYLFFFFLFFFFISEVYPGPIYYQNNSLIFVTMHLPYFLVKVHF